MQKILIKEIHLDYLADILNLEQEFENDAWSKQQLESELKLENSMFFGLFLEKQLVSYSSLRLLKGEAEILRLVTAKQHRRKGYASRLLVFLIERLKDLSCSRLILEFRESNLSALKLYEKFNFKNFSKRENYYLNPSDTALMMELGM